jgi:hypothetical protein
MAPNDFKSENSAQIKIKAEYRDKKALIETNGLNVKDKVRILKVKDKFAKGTENFARKIYNIIEIDKLSFILKNSKRVTLKKKYKNWQLKKVTTVESPVLELIKRLHSSKQVRKENKFEKLQKQEDMPETNTNKTLQPKNEKQKPPAIQAKKTEPIIIQPVKSEKLAVGSKLSVLWDNPHEWFDGVISKVLLGALIQVLYEDDDVQRHRLLNKAKNKTWKLL